MLRKIKIFKHSFERWVYNANIFTSLLWTGIISSGIYLVMYLAVGRYFMAVFMAAMIACCFSVLNKRDVNGRNTPFQMMFVLLLVYCHCMLGSFALGLECSFNLILLSTIPVCFFVEYLMRSSSFISYCLSFISLILNYVLIKVGDRFVGSDTLSSGEKILFESINWMTALFLTVLSITVFMAEVFNMSSGLSNQNRKLNELANYDPLTNLLLRRPLLGQIEKCVEEKKAYGKEYAICIGDIDFFKKFNDKYGHDCGDEVLKRVSMLIAQGVREGDYVCRWGGEEILILFPDTSVYEAVKIVERVRKTIESSSVQYKENVVRVTMTFGVSSSEKHIMSSEVIEAADKALYVGKSSGRNQVSSQ